MNGLRLLLIGGCLAALATLVHAQDPQTPVTTGAAPSEFVTRKGTHFYLRNKPYYFAGTNLWYGAYLDYLTFHMWAPNWQWYDPKKPEATYDDAWKKAQEYLDRHIDIAQKLGKPIVLEEFGLNRDGGSYQRNSGTVYRDRYYRAVFDRLEKRAAEGAPIAGTNFWAWGGLSTENNADYKWKPGDAFMGDPPQEPQGLYSVFDTDASTIAIVRAHAASMSRIGSKTRPQ